MLDSHGVIVSVNEAWQGFSRKNSLQGSDFGVGQNYLAVCERAVGDCSEEAQAVAVGIRRVLNGEAPDFSIDYPCHSPTEQLWFRLIAAPLKEKSIVGAVVMHINITEIKIAEMATNRLAAIVESSDDAIIGKDLNSTITSWNKGAEKIFGYTASEMLGTSIMRLIPPERQEEERKFLDKIKQGQSIDHFDTLRLTKDGRLIDVSVTISPIKDAQGVVIGASKAARDITQRSGPRRKSRNRRRSWMKRVMRSWYGRSKEKYFFGTREPSVSMAGTARKFLAGISANLFTAIERSSKMAPIWRSAKVNGRANSSTLLKTSARLPSWDAGRSFETMKTIPNQSLRSIPISRKRRKSKPSSCGRNAWKASARWRAASRTT